MGFGKGFFIDWLTLADYISTTVLLLLVFVASIYAEIWSHGEPTLKVLARICNFCAMLLLATKFSVYGYLDWSSLEWPGHLFQTGSCVVVFIATKFSVYGCFDSWSWHFLKAVSCALATVVFVPGSLVYVFHLREVYILEPLENRKRIDCFNEEYYKRQHQEDEP